MAVLSFLDRVDGFGRSVWVFWSIVAGGAAVVSLAAVRPGIRA